jgi:hypothetical protein
MPSSSRSFSQVPSLPTNEAPGSGASPSNPTQSPTTRQFSRFGGRGLASVKVKNTETGALFFWPIANVLLLLEMKSMF